MVGSAVNCSWGEKVDYFHTISGFAGNNFAVGNSLA